MNMRLATIVAVLSCLAVSNVDAVCQLTPGDANTLNYALTLEHLEAAFYNGLNDAANTGISASAFATAFAPDVYPYVGLIRDHENAHVQALTSALTSNGCTAVSACTYTFSTNGAYTNPVNFIATAHALETTGVAAYDGAINTIFDANLRQIAATIATVEARHTAYLALLNNFTPFPYTFDIANTTAQIYAVAGAFVNTNLTNGGSTCQFPQTTPVTFNYVNSSNFGYQAAGPVNGECGLFAGDISTLNYALALEHLEANFYTYGVNNTVVAAGLNSTVAPYLGFIRDHEQAHVAYLQNVFLAYGCNTTVANSAVPACGQYEFTSAYASTAAFLQTAQALEETGVSAYDGAINSIRDAGIRQAAATVATVEAKHAAYLRILNGQVPFPNVTDIPLDATTVINTAAQFINVSSCPVTPSGPLFTAINLNNAAFVIQDVTTNVASSGSTTQSATTATTTQSATTATTTRSATTATVGQTTGIRTTGLTTASTTITRTGIVTTSASSTVVASIAAVVALVGAVMVL